MDIKDKVSLIKDKFNDDANMIASTEDIRFLENSYQLINNLAKTMATPSQIIDLLQDCKNAFALMINKSLPQETIELCFEQYIKYLDNCSIYFLPTAFQEIIETQKFFPAIADILEKYEQVACRNDHLSNTTKCLMIKSKASVMPRTKENFNIVRQKEASERSDVESFYVTFMREHYPHLVR
jgi:hypothetical protein